MTLRSALAALLVLLALPMAAASVDFTEDSFSGEEGNYAPKVNFRATGLTAPLKVLYTHGYPTASHFAWSTLELTPDFPLGGFTAWTHDDEVYTPGQTGEAWIWYTDPATGQEVKKMAVLHLAEDEPYPVASVEGLQLREGTGDRDHYVMLRLSPVSTEPMQVALTTTDVTTDGSDYTLLDPIAYFAARTATAAVRVRVHGDAVDEGRELFHLIPAGGLGGSIVISDLPPVLTAITPNIFAGDYAELSLDLPEPLETTATAIVTSSNAAVAHPILGTARINAGQSNALIRVLTIAEGTATFTAELAGTDLPSASTTVNVYGGAIELGGENGLTLKAGEKALVPIRMTPPPPESIRVGLSSSARDVLKTDDPVYIDMSGHGEVAVQALKPGLSRLELSTPGGNLVAALLVQVIPPVVVRTVAPAAGTTAGGTAVTISGEGFSAPCTVRFGGVAATGVTVVDGTTILATTPARPASVVDVAVTCGQWTHQLPAGFTYATRGRGRAVRH